MYAVWDENKPLEERQNGEVASAAMSVQNGNIPVSILVSSRFPFPITGCQVWKRARSPCRSS